MDALEYLKEKIRMCIGRNCSDCPQSFTKNGVKMGCENFEVEYPEQAIKIVEDWSKENPVATNKDKYLEVMKETFGIDKFNEYRCNTVSNKNIPKALCNNFAICRECIEFWESEYKPVKEEE